MGLQLCLKVSYRGLIRYMICEPSIRYEEILRMAMERFDIPQEYAQMLYLSNESGYIFDKNLLEYFLLLFPAPELIFYIRLDYRRASRGARSMQSSCNKIAFGDSELTKKRARCIEEDEYEYKAVPVHRQNCFFGSLPTPNVIAKRSHEEREFSMQMAKRMRLSDAKKNFNKTKTRSSRLLRI